MSATQQRATIEPGQALRVDGRACYLGSSREYRGRYSETVDPHTEIDYCWINQEATVIDGRRDETVRVPLNTGDEIHVPGYGDYRLCPANNDNVQLVPVADGITDAQREALESMGRYGSARQTHLVRSGALIVLQHNDASLVVGPEGDIIGRF